MPESVPGLARYGFILAGAWVPSTRTKSGITFQLDDMRDERVVYAFVVAGSVLYVGVCEKDYTSLADRMGRYRSRQGSGTNRRVAGLIRECLDRSETVAIYALKPTANYTYDDLCIDLVKGLENPLISRFQPRWNRLAAAGAADAEGTLMVGTPNIFAEETLT